MNAKNWKPYAAWILFTEAVGGLAGFLTRSGMEIYQNTVLKPPSVGRSRSLRLFLLQLAFNFVWSFLFFSFRAYGLAFLWLAVLWVLIVRMLLSFYDVDRPAAWLQLPYLLWVLFAAWLNLGVWKLNG